MKLPVPPRFLAAAVFALLLIFGLPALLALFNPEKQLEKAQAGFFRAVSDKNWRKAGGWVASDYSDRWQLDRERLLREGSEATHHFLTLEVVAREQSVEMQGKEAEVRCRIRLDGMGSPIAEMVKERIFALEDPFVFRWRRVGWQPWKWELIRVEQPQLQIPSME